MNPVSNSAEKFIIVETNFRVFAYTSNKLYKEILKLFLEPRKEFPDMFFGVLTKPKVERAFKQQITANQIMSFLISHSHPEAIYTKRMKNIG
jgi:transcription initiation factor TFIIH subunit 4